MTHDELTERARRWLIGSRRCHPVFSNLASCCEIPDAIGWSSCFRWEGCTVVECKVSRADFVGDRKKYQRYAVPATENCGPIECSINRYTQKQAKQYGYQVVDKPRMGDYRFFLTPPEIVTAELVEQYAPDHGLLWIAGQRIRMVRAAQRRAREATDKDNEIRYLRFAIINKKTPFARPLSTLTQEPHP